jgi:hypothetical protein
MRPIEITRTLAAAVANGIAQSQTPLAAGALTLNGSLVTAGVAQLTTQRKVIITNASIETSRVFTITGTDGQGRVITETITVTAITANQSVKDYKTVTSITVDAATVGAITAGTNGVGISQPIPLDIYVPNSRTTISLDVTGTVNASVEFTNDNPFGDPALAEQGYTPPVPDPQPWFAHPVAGLTSATADVYGETDVPMRAVRLKTNSGAGSVRMTVTQQSLL